MKKITAVKLKEQLPGLLGRIGAEGLLITKDAKPVAKLIPIEASHGNAIGKLKRQIKIKGDIFSTGLAWTAETRSGREKSDRKRGRG